MAVTRGARWHGYDTRRRSWLDGGLLDALNCGVMSSLLRASRLQSRRGRVAARRCGHYHLRRAGDGTNPMLLRNRHRVAQSFADALD
jgi:hypothetical protein